MGLIDGEERGDGEQDRIRDALNATAESSIRERDRTESRKSARGDSYPVERSLTTHTNNPKPWSTPPPSSISDARPSIHHSRNGDSDRGLSKVARVQKATSLSSLDSVLSDLSRYLSTSKTPKQRWKSAFLKIKRIRMLSGAHWNTFRARDSLWKEDPTQTTVKSNLEMFLYGLFSSNRCSMYDRSTVAGYRERQRD